MPESPDGRGVEDRESNEFARVVNLSNAVFAIAMTLLVLTIDVPDVDTSGLVALVPFPTSVLGSYPFATAAVIPFLATFGLLGVTYLALLIRAQATHAWQQRLPDGAYRRILLAFGANTALLIAGIAVALWQPAVALGIALVSSAPTLLLLRRVPLAYRDWL